MLLGNLLTKNVRRHPDKHALIFGNTKYSFSQLNKRVNSLVNALSAMGVNKGDKVALLADDCPEYLEMQWAAAKSGIVIVPLNRMIGGRDLTYTINNSEANTLFLGANYLESVNSIRQELKSVDKFICIGQEVKEVEDYEKLISSHPPNEPEVEMKEDDLYTITYTSGTTGLPKGVMLTHKNFMASAADGVILYRLEEKDIMLNLFPYYSAALPWIMTSCFYIGASYVGVERFDPKVILETIEREKVTAVYFAAPMLIPFLDYSDIDKYDLSSLRIVHHSGAPIPVETVKKALRIFGPKLRTVLGSTECIFFTFLPPEEYVLEGPAEKVKRLASCGKEAINSEVRIVDDEGKDVPPGDIGEIITRADYLMKGYWKMPEATAEAIKGGYLYTGDMATMDDEGYIYLSDRKKDMITTGGKTVVPREVEEIIYRHPSVLEAAVIGMPDEKLGEAVKAIVVLREGKGATQEELVGLCRQNLAEHAVPKCIEFIDKLPRSPMHKVLRKTLREKYGNPCESGG